MTGGLYEVSPIGIGCLLWSVVRSQDQAVGDAFIASIRFQTLAP
jgi:hypothetical protein